MPRVIVIGGGPAGMMAAVAAAEAGNTVTLLEKNEKLGKKLYLTGKGRCNLTNNSTPETFLANIVSNHKFLHSASRAFDSVAVQDFFMASGLKIKEERGQRVFPASDKSSDVIAALKKRLEKAGVEVRLGTAVRELEVENGEITGVIIAGGETLPAERVIVATGGLSYPSTGATGDGLRFAAASGHEVTDPVPALVPLEVREGWCQDLQGLSLRNIAVVMESAGKQIFSGFGEILFTHFGVSGPLALSASSYYARAGAGGATLTIDLKPALSAALLDKRLLRDFAAQSNKAVKNALDALLPPKLRPVIIALSGLAPERKVHEITKTERLALVSLLKALPLTVTGTRGYPEAIITQGGVSVRDLNPATMESRRVRGLYFAGEVLDVDALTGGFNLQIAWCTGYVAGKVMSERESSFSPCAVRKTTAKSPFVYMRKYYVLSPAIIACFSFPRLLRKLSRVAVGGAWRG